jgi:hypothetical protein
MSRVVRRPVRVPWPVPFLPALAIAVGVLLFGWLTFFVSREMPGIYQQPTSIDRLVARLRTEGCENLNTRSLAEILDAQRKMLQGAAQLQKLLAGIARYTSLLLVVLGAGTMNAVMKGKRPPEPGERGKA